ncbi:hypothetical protein B0H19DRAFT_1058683 [Mycena capillaripes]|nr:hypothetical protein B0H19DRAFT_1058683 [Mycena capillaripes]
MALSVIVIQPFMETPKTLGGRHFHGCPGTARWIIFPEVQFSGARLNSHGLAETIKLAAPQVQRTPQNGVRRGILDLDLWWYVKLSPRHREMQNTFNWVMGSSKDRLIGNEEEQPMMKTPQEYLRELRAMTGPFQGQKAMHPTRKHQIGQFRCDTRCLVPSRPKGSPSYSALAINEEKEDRSHGNEEKSAKMMDVRGPKERHSVK